MKTRKKTAIITVNYNGGEMTCDTVRSLIKETTGSYHLIMVDNGSTDGVAAKLKQEFPQIIVLENPENLGFGGGNNTGIEYALAKGYEYICLVNNDIFFTPNWLEGLEAFLDNDSSRKIGAVNPLILFSHDYYLVPMEISHLMVFFYSQMEKRLMLNNLHAFINSNRRFPHNYKENIGGKDFIRPQSRKFKMVFPANESQNNFEFQVYDPFYSGFNINSGDKVIHSGAFIEPFLRKLRAKLMPFAYTSAKTVRIKVSEFVAANGLKPQKLINSFGGVQIKGHLPIDNLYTQELRHTPENPKEVDYFHAATVLIRADVFSKIGLFDRDYFMYYEDADLSMRVRKAGYQIWATPESHILHREGGTSSEKTTGFMTHSRQIYSSRWLNE